MKKALLVLCAAMGISASAQTPVYEYGFDAAFTPEWTQTNQSSPTSTSLWNKAGYTTPPTNSIFGSNGALPSGQAGGVNSFALVNYTSTTGLGTISNWLITPSVSVKDGDVVSFFTRKGTDGNTDYPDRLELRMSPVAGFALPTGATSVGSFTTLGVTVNPDLLGGFTYPKTWTKYQFTVSGVGSVETPVRFGFRYFVTDGGIDGNNSDLIGIDTFAVTRATMGTTEVADSDMLTISPNPASDFIIVSSKEKVGRIGIYDMSGKLVASTLQDGKADIRHLAKGAYIIQVETAKGVTSQKFIKK